MCKVSSCFSPCPPGLVKKEQFYNHAEELQMLAVSSLCCDGVLGAEPQSQVTLRG